MRADWKDIGTLLLEYGLLSNNDLKEGVTLQKETGLRLGEALVRLGKISMEDVDWVLSKQLDIPFVIVEDVTPNLELLGKFQKKFLIENRILPLYETEDQISLVAEDPFNKAAISFIEESFGKKAGVSTGSGRKIKELLVNAFREVIFPELVSALESITGKIRNTSFYRIDFLIAAHSCKINIFGSGILKNIMTVNGDFRKEDVFSAFGEMGIPFLYAHGQGYKKTFLAVYPLVNKFDLKGRPAIIGGYGLFLPDDIYFSDADGCSFPDFFHSAGPVQGYGYLAVKKDRAQSENSVCVIDAAPHEFGKRCTKIIMPRKCRRCSGEGCAACGELGYHFDKVEGFYSSAEIREMKEKDHAED